MIWHPNLWIRLCDVWAARAVCGAGSSQRRAGDVEHLPRRAEVSLGKAPHVEIRWEGFYSWDSSRRGRKARDVYWTAATQQGDITKMLGNIRWQSEIPEAHDSFVALSCHYTAEYLSTLFPQHLSDFVHTFNYVTGTRDSILSVTAVAALGLAVAGESQLMLVWTSCCLSSRTCLKKLHLTACVSPDFTPIKKKKT